MTRNHTVAIVLAALVTAQIVFAFTTRGLQPYWSVLPPVPTARAVAAEAFGDDEFLYRDWVMDLQNFGDTGGHWTALRDYDMHEVIRWLQVLDRLDIDADHHITLAARYFSQTQNKSDLPALVAYIREHVGLNPAKKVKWLNEALFLADVRIHDKTLALAIADQLATYDYPSMSVLAYQLPAVMHEQAGDFRGAAILMAQARHRLQGRIPDDQIQGMDQYVADMQAKAQ